MSQETDNTRTCEPIYGNDAQDSQSTQLQAIPARKPSRSIKPPHIKQAVIAKAMIGTSKLQISKDMGITENTVRKILSEGDLHEHVQQVRSAFVIEDKLWKAKEVLVDKLENGSESAATSILKGFNVLQARPDVQVQVNLAQTWVSVKEDSEKL